MAVLKDGMTVEKGRHETLVNVKDGFYASLVELRSNPSQDLTSWATAAAAFSIAGHTERPGGEAR